MVVHKLSWFRKNLTLLLGILSVVTSLLAVAGWSKEALFGWVEGKAVAASTADSLLRMDRRVSMVSGRVDAVELRMTKDERANDIDHTQLLTELPIIKEDLKDIKKDLKTLLNKTIPIP